MKHLEKEVTRIPALKNIMLYWTVPVKWDRGRIIGKNTLLNALVLSQAVQL